MVVPDRCFVALICVMACVSLLSQKNTACTLHPNQSLALTRTWARVNTIGWCRGHHRQTQNLRLLLMHIADRLSAQVPMRLNVVPQDWIPQGRSHQAIGPGSAVWVEQEDLSFVYGEEMKSCRRLRHEIQ